jgi:arginase family enzyme
MDTLFGVHSGTDGKTLVVGVPFDHGSTHFPGSALGPQILRHLSSDLRAKDGTLIDLGSGKHFLDAGQITDLGDIPYSACRGRERYLSDLEQLAYALIRENKRPLFLGGDHLISLPLIRGVARATGGLQVIQIDAHTDCAPVKSDDLPTHANFIAFLNEEKAVDSIVQIGVRGLTSSEARLPTKVQSLRNAEELSSILVPGLPVYLTVDTDGFDPALFTAVGHPEPEGLEPRALEAILSEIHSAGCPIVGVDWTEYNPQFDTKNYFCGRMILRQIARILRSMQ